MSERNIRSKVLTLDYPRRKGRIDVYDFLRGFAMLLVMLQHAGCPGNHYILTFHMPLFFFLSGLVGGGRELPPFKDYFVSRFKRLMVPYFCFGFLMLTVYWVTGMMNHHPYDVLSAAYGVLTCQLGYAPIGTNGLYWFLPCMFVADLLVYPVSRYLRSCRFGNWGGAISFLILSYLTTHLYAIPIFMIQQSFMAAAFLLVGSACKPYSDSLKDESFHWWGLLLAVLSCLLVVLSYRMNSDRVLMLFNQYGHYGWFLLGAVAGIVASLIIGKYFYLLLRCEKQGFSLRQSAYRLFMWMGFNSLVLFPVHLIVNHYFGALYRMLGINHFPLRFAAMLIIGIPICNLITNYLPWMLGQSSKRGTTKIIHSEYDKNE